MATLVVKASFQVGTDGSITLAAEQLDITEADAETPFGMLESDVVPIKNGCDFAVYGPAMSATPVATMDVSVRVGEFQRTVRVTGDRVWQSTSAGLGVSAPVPFKTMPLDYSRAFGGEAILDEDVNGPYPDNPMGRGWVAKAPHAIGTRLPNVEEVDQLLTSWEEQPMPAGLLPLPRTSALRGLRGITADLKAQRTSLSPDAFVWSHPRMQLRRYPAEEIVTVLGMTEAGRWQVRLPAIDLSARVRLGDKVHVLGLTVDTLGIVPSYQRFWAVARRAFVYQFLPEREREVRVDATPSEAPETMTTTIAAELGTNRPLVPIKPPDEPERMPIPFEMLRELHPLTSVIENLPLCASG